MGPLPASKGAALFGLFGGYWNWIESAQLFPAPSLILME
jgi:hypothetical protein